MEQLLLGIDVGTSATKVSAFNLRGKEVYSVQNTYPLLTPSPGQVEQDPEEWWNAAAICLREVTKNVDPGLIAGIGVAGQSWGVVPLDAEGHVLANSPLWMDTRAAKLCEAAEKKVGEDRIFAVAGNPLSPTYSTGKALWFATEQPKVHAKSKWYLQSNSFIVYRLTGKATQDLSQTYAWHFSDIATGTYNLELAAELGLDANKVPPAVPSDHVVGSVSAYAAQLTGLVEGTPVVAGGLDAACGALGAGVFRPGQCQEQGGQAGGISVATDRPLTDPSLICSPHVVPGIWLLQGGTAAGGASLRWAAEQFAPDLSFALIDEEAADVPAGSGGITFLPYLSGERSPHWDPVAQGVFFGLTFASTRPALLRAVMEGVAYSLLDNVRVIEMTGAHLGDIYTIGGASKSKVWTQMKADVLGRPLRVPATSSATTLGAALLAGVGTGCFPTYERAVSATTRWVREQVPGPDADHYALGFPIFQRLYADLKSLMATNYALITKEQ